MDPIPELPLNARISSESGVPPTLEGNAQYFAAVVSHYNHQTKMIWLRFQVFGLVQAVLFFGMYKLLFDFPHKVAGVIGAAFFAFVGMILTVNRSRSFRRDIETREHNGKLVETLANAFYFKHKDVGFDSGHESESAGGIALLETCGWLLGIHIVLIFCFLMTPVFRDHFR